MTRSLAIVIATAAFAAPAAASPIDDCSARVSQARGAVQRPFNAAGTVAERVARLDASLTATRTLVANAIGCARQFPALANVGPSLAQQLAHYELGARVAGLQYEAEGIDATLRDDAHVDLAAAATALAAWRDHVRAYRADTGDALASADAVGAGLDELLANATAQIHARAAQADAADHARADAEHVHAMLVTTRQPELTVDDSYDLAKVAAAFAAADPAMFVHLSVEERAASNHVELSKPIRGAYLVWAPAPRDAVEVRAKLKPCDLGRFGVGDVFTNVNGFLEVARCTRPTQPMVNTVGLLWGGEPGKRLIFVTADGGRYEVNVSPATTIFEFGVPKPDAWAPPLATQALDAGDFDALVKAGHLAPGAVHALATATAGWNACHAKIWNASTREYDANDAADIRAETREARSRQIGDKYAARSEAQCAAHKKAFGAGLTSALEARAKQRLAIYDKLKARLAAP